MKGKFDYLIVRCHELGWEIKQQGKRIVSASNVVEAIDIANRLAEYESAVHQRMSRVLIVDERITPKTADG
ncbi:hypothetical protein Y882_17790 [Dyella japonica DSM 16301]|uniref:Uncharacterized protein n=2 Tax=Dyella japonica TaxID=231455 RepID=A0A0G9GXL8_9GAMM|nr:hypothetical protein Y882_17790 [Dyella japonica DSM 16301]